MKNHLCKRALSLLLVFCLILSLLPTAVAIEQVSEPAPYAFSPEFDSAAGIQVHNQTELVAAIKTEPEEGSYTSICIANSFEITSPIDVPVGAHLFIYSASNDAMYTLTGSETLPEGMGRQGDGSFVLFST